MTTWGNYTERKGLVQHTVAGTVKLLENFRSPQLANSRDILVYLPPSYGLGTKRYPVIYMHDGQNLFDQASSYAGEWQVDETLETASEAGLDAIVVGIPNMGVERMNEYSPFVDGRRGGGKGDKYVAFLVETLKPRIDRDFRTLPDRGHTGIAGSSMGGLISLYAFFRAGHTFGLAGVMSPALWFAQRAIFSFVQRTPFVSGKLYLDMGTREGAGMVADARRMEALLRRKGYRAGADLLYVEEVGAPHHESAWARRFGPALAFLLGHAARPALPRHDLAQTAPAIINS